VDTLIKSLETLIQQSTEALGPEDPSTLNLKQQLAAILEARQPARKVFWIKADGFSPTAGEKKG
jgi:hypothetical protein